MRMRTKRELLQTRYDEVQSRIEWVLDSPVTKGDARKARLARLYNERDRLWHALCHADLNA